MGLLVIAILVAWRWVPARLAIVPGPLVAIVVVTIISMVLPFKVSRIELDGSVLDAVRLPSLPHGIGGSRDRRDHRHPDHQRAEPAHRGVDRPHAHRPRTDFNRELIGQGAANIASGALGGLPIAGVIVRSSANVNAGAKTRASTIMHGFWVLVFAVPLPGWSKRSPPPRLPAC